MYLFLNHMHFLQTKSNSCSVRLSVCVCVWGRGRGRGRENKQLTKKFDSLGGWTPPYIRLVIISEANG